MSRYTDKILPYLGVAVDGEITVGEVYFGKNLKTPRLTFHPIEDVTTADNFTHPVDGAISGSWWRDAGDIAMPESDREPRLICRKGKATFTVTGPTVIVRIMVNPGFGTADVLIDGVIPSTIFGAVDVKNTLSCAAEEYLSLGNEYRDVVLADNLTNTTHTVELFCNNTDTGTGGYVPLAGFCEINTAFDQDISAWLLPFGSGQNLNGLTFSNISGVPIRNVAINFPSDLLDENGVQIANYTADPMPNASSHSVEFTPDFTGSPGEIIKNVSVSYEFEDPSGVVEHVTTIVIDSHDEDTITYSAGWTLDTSVGVNRAFAETIGKTAIFPFTGENLTVKIQKDYGWGKLEVYVDDVLVATLDCHDDVGGGFFQEYTFTGSGGSHTGKLRNKLAKPAPFAQVSYTTTKKYSAITENMALKYQVADCPPFAPANPELLNGDVSYDVPAASSEDLSIPRSNTGLSKVRSYGRFPTFCVYYANGKEDVLSQYDIVVIDPHAVSRQQVARFQAKGIKVLAYISFGEEDGTILNPFSPASDKGPWVGDGTGPGGYAGYYCKGGNRFGEQSECTHDCQRMSSSKTCAKSRAEYWTDPGRCSPACGNDWREGYSTWDAGGECAGGYTKANNWSRSAMVACKNSACPQYDPLNQSCPEYDQADGCWGQDFSILTTNYPDENGIWASFFIDASGPKWGQRLRDYYFPSVFGEGVVNTSISCTVTTETTDAGTGPCIRVPTYPVDPDEPVEVRNALGYLFTSGRDYSYDAKLGTFSLTPDTEQGAPAISAGDVLSVTYTRLGLEADGVFMDTVDSVDVYPSPAYQTGMTDLINGLKAEYPTKLFCSNRGFTILNDIIQSCEFVMFESFLSDYNWETDTYSLITDPASIAFNNGIIEQLKTLRKTNVFDVLALNYCHNGSAGATLRQSIYDSCRALGFLCWTSTILLNDPENLEIIVTSTGPFRSNAWRKIREQRIP